MLKTYFGIQNKEMSAAKSGTGGWCCDRILGTGGFGVVQLWIHPASGRKLAIKKCKWDAARLTDVQKKRWVNEVYIMKRLQHPNIVKTVDLPFKFLEEEQSLPALCMEYCKKGDLRKVLNNPENCCGVSEQDAVTVIRNITSAVEYLHSYGITHRDLKPENIVLQDEGTSISYKLIDLGYAKELGEASTSASIVGTLNYVAPELLWRKRYSCTVDYWSLGILFYELITGSRPFLPNMPQPIAWMQHIKNKGYEDIRAYEKNGSIIFGKDIEEPTQVSGCLKERLVEWFRIVLRWDPKERGKKCDENGVPQLVVFTLLNSILSKRIVHVFYTSLYRTKAYEVYDSTTVLELQRLIQSDINVQATDQILTDYFGKALIAEKPLVSQIRYTTLFLFKNRDTTLSDIPMVDIPAPVQEMMLVLQNQLDYDTLKNYYRLTIFFMKKEVDLFKLYIFALSIKADLLISALKALETKIGKMITNVSAPYGVHCNPGNKLLSKEQMKLMQVSHEETQALLNNANRISQDVSALLDESLKDLTQIYADASNIYEALKRTRTDKCGKPNGMLKLVFEFLKTRETQFQSGSVVQVTQQMLKLEDKFVHLEDTVEPVFMVFHDNHQNENRCTLQTAGESLHNRVQSSQSLKPLATTSNGITNPIVPCLDAKHHVLRSFIPQCSEITESDDIIYDNLMIRNTLNNLLMDMQNTVQSTWMT